MYPGLAKRKPASEEAGEIPRFPASGSVARSVAKRTMRVTEEMRRRFLPVISFTVAALDDWLINDYLLSVKRLIARWPQRRNSP